MEITIIAVGKLKEDYLKSAIESCQKELRKQHVFNIIEVPDEKAPENLSEAMMERIKELEGERILRHVQPEMYVYTLEIQGKAWSDETFNKKIKQVIQSGKTKLVFIIGGSLGLSQQVLQRSNEGISFSKMTFPHQLMRVILAERLASTFSELNYL